MTHVNLIDPSSSSAAVKPTLDRSTAHSVPSPNMFGAVANFPAGLNRM